MSCGIIVSDEFLDAAATCRRKITKPLQYYCNALPISNLTDHRKLIFLGRASFFW